MDASAGGQPRVDALVALSQRTVWVATWTSLGDDYRTLVNSNQLSALPIFTGYDALEEAARRFGWQAGDGSIPFRELGAREVLRHAIAHNLEYVVIDIADDHSLEIERKEIEPLLSTHARNDSVGPYAAVGRISSDMMRAVSSRPPSGRPNPPSVPPPAVPAAAASKPPNFSTQNSKPSVPPPRPMSDAPTPTGPVQVSALQSEPSDALLNALSELLRGYPEVEWAALCLVAHGPAGPVPSVGVRIDAGFRQRVDEIASGIRKAGDQTGAPIGTLVLDDAAIIRTVRADGYLFYPWKKRAGS